MEKILVVGPSWIGDMVMAQSLFMTLKNNYPGCIIDVVAPEWSIPLIERMPEVNKAISLPVKHKQLALIKRYKIGRSLRAENYQTAIIIPRSYKSALVPFFAKIPERIGYRGEMRYGILNDIRCLDKTILKQTVQRYVNLGFDGVLLNPPETPLPRLSIRNKNRDELLRKYKLSVDKAIIGLMPGAEYGSAKKWPYFKKLARALVDNGYQVWVFGSEKDFSYGNEIALQDSGIVNLCGKTELIDVVDLISLCNNNVSNDSGLMHIAAAVNIPLVAIYGSSTPEYTPPLTNKAKIEYLALECSPCFKRECPLGHTNCLKNITIDDVLKDIKTISG